MNHSDIGHEPPSPHRRSVAAWHAGWCPDLGHVSDLITSLGCWPAGSLLAVAEVAHQSRPCRVGGRAASRAV